MFSQNFAQNWNPIEVFKNGDIMTMLNGHYWNYNKNKSYKDGQITVLNADAAKVFKKDKGFVIKFGEIMTFIKEMIEAEAPKNETTVKI
jgi:hypothetical protein